MFLLNSSPVLTVIASSIYRDRTFIKTLKKNGMYLKIKLPNCIHN